MLFSGKKTHPAPKDLNLFGEQPNQTSDTKLLDELMTLDASPTKVPSEEDSPARFSAQWNKLFGQEPSNIDDSTVPDLRLDTLGQDNDEFGSFFSSSKEEKETTTSDKAILPSQLFDLDQSLFSLQTPRQGIKFLQSLEIHNLIQLMKWKIHLPFPQPFIAHYLK